MMVHPALRLGPPTEDVISTSHHTLEDTAAESAALTIEHAGGWSPMPEMGEYFTTPRFFGTVRLNIDNTYIALSAKATAMASSRFARLRHVQVSVPDRPQILSSGLGDVTDSARGGESHQAPKVEKEKSFKSESQAPKRKSMLDRASIFFFGPRPEDQQARRTSHTTPPAARLSARATAPRDRARTLEPDPPLRRRARRS